MSNFILVFDKRDNILTELDAYNLQWLWWFGNLIGNDDMHYGNISLFRNRAGSFQLAPCYDMLPMRYRPTNSGELITREPDPLPPPPQAFDIWRSASSSAADFWERIKEEAEISPDFRDIAVTNLQIITKLRAKLA